MKYKINCMALLNSGLAARRCREVATTKEMYHGDGECYTYDGTQPKHVMAYFCDMHRSPYRYRCLGFGPRKCARKNTSRNSYCSTCSRAMVEASK